MKLNVHKTPTSLEMLVFVIQVISEKEISAKKLFSPNVDQTVTETVWEFVFAILDILKILQISAFWITDALPMKLLMEMENVFALRVSTETLKENA